MSDRIERTFDKIRAMPMEQQSHIADLMDDVVADHMTAPPLSAEEERMIDVAIASIEAGRGVSGPELDAFWTRHRK